MRKLQGPPVVVRCRRDVRIGSQFAAMHESASVQVFGCRDGGIIRALERPASEKRQGTKSRDVGGSSAAGAMGIWPRAQVRLDDAKRQRDPFCHVGGT